MKPAVSFAPVYDSNMSCRLQCTPMTIVIGKSAILNILITSSTFVFSSPTGFRRWDTSRFVFWYSRKTGCIRSRLQLILG